VSEPLSPTRVSTWTMVLMWFTAALVYYGLTLSATSTSTPLSAPPWSCQVSEPLSPTRPIRNRTRCAAELPSRATYPSPCRSGVGACTASVMACVLLERPELGRRLSCVLFYLVGGVSCVAAAMVPQARAATALVMVGKFTLTAVFDIIYQYSSEIFPTPIRSRAMGMCSASARVGSMVAPQVVLLGALLGTQPAIIFGVASLVTAFAAVCTLPGELPAAFTSLQLKCGAAFIVFTDWILMCVPYSPPLCSD
jgi:hypothetical protein